MTTAVPKQYNISKCSKEILYVLGVYSLCSFSGTFIHSFFTSIYSFSTMNQDLLGTRNTKINMLLSLSKSLESSKEER